MNPAQAPARINVQLIIILVIIVVIGGTLAAVGYKVRKRMIADASLKAGQAAAQAENWSEASKQLRLYLQRYPDDEQSTGANLLLFARVNLSFRPLESKHLLTATAAFRRYIRIYPDQPDSIAVMAKLTRIYESLLYWNELEYIARLWLEMQPGNSRAQVALIAALTEQRKMDEAREVINRFIDQGQTDKATGTDLAHACVIMAQAVTREATNQPQQELIAQTLKWLDMAKQFAPESPRVAYTRAIYYSDPRVTVEGNRAEHIRTELAAIKDFTQDDPRLLQAICDIRTGLGDYDQAARLLELAEEFDQEYLAEYLLDPAIWEPLRSEAAIKWRLAQEQMQQAAEIARQALSPENTEQATITEPRLRVSLLPIAIKAFALAGDVESAQTCMAEYDQQTAGLDLSVEQENEIYLLRAQIARANGDWHKMIRELEPLVRRAPNEAQGWLMLSEAADAVEDVPRAITSLQEYLKLRPYDANMTRNLARAFLDNGQVLQASLFAETAARLTIARRIADHFGRTDAVDIQRLLDSYQQHSDWRLAIVQAELSDSPNAIDGAISTLDLTDLASEIVALKAVTLGAIQDGNPQEISDAQRRLRTAMATHPEEPGFPVLLAELMESAGAASEDADPAAIESLLKTTVDDSPDNFEAQLSLAQFYARERAADESDDSYTARIQKARQAIDSITDRFSTYAESWRWSALITAISLPKEASAQTVTDILTKGIEATSGKEQHRLILSLAAHLYANHQRNEAVALLRKQIESVPQDIESRSLLLEMGEVRQGTIEGLPENFAQSLIDELRQIEGDSGRTWRYHQAQLWIEQDPAAHAREIVSQLNYCVQADRLWLEPVQALAEFYVQQNDIDTALSTYTSALRRNPRAMGIATRISQLYARRGQSPPPDVVQLLRLDPASTAMQEAFRAERTGRVAVAIENMQRVIDENPNNTRALLELGRLLYEHRRQTDRAIELIDRVHELQPLSSEPIDLKATILMYEGDDEQADSVVAEHATQLQQRFAGAETPELQQALLDALRLQAVHHLRRGRVAQAETTLNQMSKSFPDSPAPDYAMGVFYLRQNRLDEAVALLDTSIAKHPDVSELKINLFKALLQRQSADDLQRAGDLLTELKTELGERPFLLEFEAALARTDPGPRYEKAEAIYNKLLESQPDNFAAHIGLLEIHVLRGELDLASEHALAAEKINPNHPDLLYRLAQVDRLQGRPRSAWQKCRQILSANPNNDRALLLLMTLIVSHPNSATQESIELFLSGIVDKDSRQTNPTARAALATCYILSNELDRAKAMIEEATRIEPENLATLRARALLAATRFDSDELKATLDSYRQQDPADLSLLVIVASTLIEAEQPESIRLAQGLIDLILAKAPDNLSARNLKARIALNQGDYSAAEETLRGLHADFPDRAVFMNDLAWGLVAILRGEFRPTRRSAGVRQSSLDRRSDQSKLSRHTRLGLRTHARAAAGCARGSGALRRTRTRAHA
jgi:predicted Zn-dependent protease